MDFQFPTEGALTGAIVTSDLQLVADVLVSPVGGKLKRAVDVTLALLALVWLSPLFVLVAAMVRLSDRGPIFYRHMRVGCGGRMFPCLKFRTMVVNGEEVLERHLRASSAAAREWAETRKLKVDPRVTAIGAVLRQLSIDELPQLLNVLRGEMSLVGPRPIVPDELKHYGADAKYYLQTRPGVTGLWQISGRNDVSYAERVAFDREYVRRWSFWKDMTILAKTVPAVLLAKGSY